MTLDMDALATTNLAVNRKLLEEIAIAADYWATVEEPRMTNLKRCHSLALSILEILDTGLQDEYALLTALGETSPGSFPV